MYITAYTDLRSLQKRDFHIYFAVNNEIYYFVYVKNMAVENQLKKNILHKNKHCLS